MSLYLKDEGFVLKIKNIKETDAIVSFFGRNYGKIYGLVKNLKISPKNIYIFDQSHYLKIFFVKKNERVKIISGIVLKELEIKDLKSWLWALNVIKKFTLEFKKENEIFNLLLISSKILKFNISGFKPWFLLKILKIMGLFNENFICACQRNLEKEDFCFFKDGWFCKNCIKKGIKVWKNDLLKIKKIALSNFPQKAPKVLIEVLKNILQYL